MTVIKRPQAPHTTDTKKSIEPNERKLKFNQRNEKEKFSKA